MYKSGLLSFLKLESHKELLDDEQLSGSQLGSRDMLPRYRFITADEPLLYFSRIEFEPFGFDILAGLALSLSEGLLTVIE